jgi:hypothetical protein
LVTAKNSKIKRKNKINKKFNLRVYKPPKLARALIGSMDWIWFTLKKNEKKKYKT